MSAVRIFSLVAAVAMAAQPIVAAAQQAEAVVPAFNPPEGAPQCRGAQGYAADFDGRRTFLWRPQWLQSIAARAEADPAYRKGIVRLGERALEAGPFSVTDKPKLPPGATANDYASIGPYWWPDPKKRDGLPYIRKDGQVNPERDGPEFDRSRLRDFGNAMRDLAVAYFVTGEERFAEHGAALLRTWFIDPGTRMNPHFEFAQGVPGKVNGRGEGIIESADLSTVVEAIGLLGPSPALTGADQKALQAWYRDMAIWLATSENGDAEMRKTNNHGVFYDFYLSHFALMAGDAGVVANVVKAFPDYRLGVQMDTQGRFINELKRTRSWHYAHFVVDGAARLATIGECAGLDLWAAQTADGRGLDDAWAFLQRYDARGTGWPFQDIDLAAGKFEKLAGARTGVSILYGKGAALPQEAELP